MRLLVVLLLLPTAAAGPLIVGVVPDLAGPGPGDEGFAIAGEGSLAGWRITDGETTWQFPEAAVASPAGTWFVGNTSLWHLRGGPNSIWEHPLQMGNDGDSLHLLGPDGSEQDAFYWGHQSTSAWQDWAYTSPQLWYQRAYDPSADAWIDTDTTADWRSARPHRVGETDAPRATVTVQAVTAYASPDSSFDVLVNLMRGAHDGLQLHVYELRSHLLVDELVAAARRGVTVEVLVDRAPVGMDAWERHETANGMQRIMDAGGHAYLAGSERYRFHHLKVLIVDDDVAIQSENWVASGVPADSSWGNRGWGIVLHGAGAATVIGNVLAQDRAAWDTVPFEMLDFDPTFRAPPTFDTPRASYKPAFPATRFEGPFDVLPVITPEHTANPAADPVAAAIAGAQHRVWMQQLDLSVASQNRLGWSQPDVLQGMLWEAKGQGADVRVMAAPPFHVDDIGNRNALAELNAHGVAACTFNVPDLRLHNKGVVADDTVYVGSMNANHHSRSMNRELGVLVTDQRVASYYAALFEADWQYCPSGHFAIPTALPMPLLALLLVALRRPCFR